MAKRPSTARTVLAGAVLAGALGTAVQEARARALRGRISWASGGGSLHDGALHARTLGDGAAGVVLLHGLGGSGAYWGAAYDTLAGTGRLVVPDLLGFGASPRPPSGYTVDDHVDALVAVLGELGVTGPVVVGAHSLGGLVALALAERRPDLVAGVVAFCAPLYTDEASARDRIARLGWLERQLATEGGGARALCRWVCDHREAAAAVAAVVRPGMPAAIRRDGVQHSWASYSETFRHVLAAAQGGGWLAALDVPVELVAGTADAVLDLDYLGRLAEELSHVTLTIRPGADHALPLTDPVGAVAILSRVAVVLTAGGDRGVNGTSPGGGSQGGENSGGEDAGSTAVGATGGRGAYRYRAVVFDMDGVVTDTAGAHAAAWKQLFDEVLAARSADPGVDARPFDADADYRRHVDGRSREDGVATFLATRGVHLPPGGPDDPDRSDTVWALAAHKNELFLERARQGVRAFPSTVALLRRLRRSGVRTALVSASRNAEALLDAAGVAELFDARIDGSDAAELGLPGKPDPAMFAAAADRLGVAPADAVAVEDAVAGVEAARRAGFGLVVGVDRAGRRAELSAAGAHVVVDDLGQLDLGAVATDAWTLVYEGLDSDHEGHREALTTLGNGYLATRGAAPESRDDGVHYPGTYLAGVYNRLTSAVGGRSVEDEHLVNAPNWLPLDLRTEDGAWWSEGGLRALEERRELDLRRGLLTRRLRLADHADRVVAVVQRRLVSMARPHVAALETTVVAEGFSGPLEVRSGVDGDVVNDNVAEYAELSNRHLEPVAVEETGASTLLVEAATTQSRIRIAVAARTTVDGAEPASGRWDAADASAAHVLTVALRDGEPTVVDKVAAYATSSDRAISNPRLASLAELSRVDTLATLLPAHEQAWRHLWDRFAVAVDDGAAVTALELNLHVFHLLQTLSAHTVGVDAGVPARGLHGEGYRGHVFWDELFVFPMLSLRAPALTRSLLAYRWRRLDAARDAARAAGLAGAMFPWQSGSDGREETPAELFNPRSQRWMADNSRLQRHVSLAVAYNAWHYHQVTEDVEYLADQGAELIVEVARLFASLAVHDPDDDRYDIAGAMGPDEYHDRYPGAPTPGLRNNAYTNVLAAWVFCRALDTVRLLDGHHCGPLWERLGLEAAELERWERLSRRLRVPFHDGVISQFEGYEALAEFDWDGYRARYGNIGRLDLILEAEGDSTNRYKLSKQADVLMLFYLLPLGELRGLLDRLGYALASDTVARTVDYYLARTAHGSTLSRVVHAWVLARSDRARSWSIFCDALRADLDDTQGGTTEEGIHLGAMASTVDLVLRGYAGVAVRDDVLWLDPHLPEEVERIAFDLFYRGQRVGVEATPTRLRLALRPCAAAPIRVDVDGRREVLVAGETYDFPLVGPSTP